MFRLPVVAFVLANFVCGARFAIADPVGDFYSGKQIHIVVGYGTGGAYDEMARLVGRYLPKYIPGNPAIVIDNMPGAGSLAAANYLYNTAPKDGTFIGTFSRDMPVLAVLGRDSNVRFDARKFNWLGSASSYANDGYLLWVRSSSPIMSIDDLRRSDGPRLILASTAQGSGSNDIAVLLRDALKLNLQIVVGYTDNAAECLAVDRGEADGLLMGLTATNALRPQWLKQGSDMRALLQFARTTRHPLFPNTPTADELASDDNTRALLALAETSFKLAWPMAAPPAVPPDRVEALEKAFVSVQSDPDYLADAKRMNFDISPIDGKEISSLITQLYGAPPAALDYMRKLQAGSQ